MTAEKVHQNCDECGRNMLKAQRVYKGHRYCTTCYARVFKRRLCPQCGNYARLPKNVKSAVCKKCEISQPCVRCKKIGYKVGKITQYGPVCTSCAPYFREPKPCGQCGVLSTRLTRVARLKIDTPVCPKCARQDHGVCQACRRYRLLMETSDGRRICKVCLDNGEIPCPSCKQSMPAGRGKQCEACYWREVFRQRLKVNEAALILLQMQKEFNAFGEWLLITVGGQKASLSLQRYLPFFMEMEKNWGRIPGYASLLSHFSAEGLRRVRLPMRWLTEVHQVMPDDIVRENDSELRRIKVLMQSMPQGSIAEKALSGYYNMLMVRVKQERTTLRSVRLSLRSAVSLLSVADLEGEKLPDQQALDSFLLLTPGQKSSVTGIAQYLNAAYGMGLIPKINTKKVNQLHRKKLEKELHELMKNQTETDVPVKQWLSICLAYFHGLPKSIGNSIKIDDVIASGHSGYVVNWKGSKYWIPKIPPFGSSCTK